MLVMNVVSSKRQRRPNVRLGEIGDMSAAWACGFSHRNRQRLVHKQWNNDFVHQTLGHDHDDDEDNPNVFGDLNPSSPKFQMLGVSPQISIENHQNEEKELALDCPNSAELIDITNSKLKFRDVTRKSRGVKRRGRSKNGCYAGHGGSWSSKHSSDGFSMDEKECQGTGDSANGFGDSSDLRTPTSSREEYGIDQPSTRRERKLLNNHAHFTGEEDRSKSGNVREQTRIEDEYTNSVGRWLQEVGFGKYAGVFEMHEVDEEVLPLLTIEDLKEIGVLSVGSRRKLYNAIQRLRSGEEETV